MHRTTFFLIVTLLFTMPTFAQLGIEECYEKAVTNYPLIKQYGLIEQSREYNLSNAARAWLPQITLNAKASYQSDVTKIPLDFSQVPTLANMEIAELSKGQYGVTLDITQMLWDGGATKAQSEQIKAQTATENEELKVNLYAIKERINQIFFGILFCDAMLEQNCIFQENLQQNFDRVRSCIIVGLANQADLDAVKVEQIKAKQNFTQISHNRKAYLTMLSAFIGEKLDENAVLQKPEIEQTVFAENDRPELSLFDSKLAFLDAQKSGIKASLMPKFNLFFTGGYGNPGLNMLKDGFMPYAIGGVRMSWNISSFYTFKNRINQLETQRENIATQRETFLFNSNLQATGKQNDIEKYRELLADDDEIIALRQSVKRATEKKVESGTATVSDLIRETNAEALARQDKILHELEMLQTVYNLKYITNK